MNGLFGFGWYDTIMKLITFSIITMLYIFCTMYLNKEYPKNIQKITEDLK